MPVWMRNALALTLAAFCLLAPCGRFARAQEEPSGAVLATVTVKPWLRPMATAANGGAETPAPSASAFSAVSVGTAASPTAPPSSLSETETEAAASPVLPPTPEPLPLPTPTPKDVTLPGVLELENPHVFRMLLIGTDAYSVKQKGRSDTMVVLQVDTRSGDIRLVSFLRDLYVPIPGHGRTRLNAAYVYGGADLLRQTLLENFGVTVDRTLAVNFSLMVELIDRIGGVTVDVSGKELRQLNSILKYYNTRNGYKQKDQLLAEAGTQTLTGKQALCFSRIRKIDSDFARTNRQRKVLEAIYARVRSLDPLTLAQLLSDSIRQVSTDLTLTDAVALVPVLMQLDAVHFKEMTVPAQGSFRYETISGMDVLVPDLEENRAAIAAFLQ